MTHPLTTGKARRESAEGPGSEAHRRQCVGENQKWRESISSGCKRSWGPGKLSIHSTATQTPASVRRHAANWGRTKNCG